MNDSTLQFVIMAVLTLAAAFIPIAYTQRHSRKLLAWQLADELRLIEVNRLLRDKVTVLLHDQPIEDLTLLLVQVANLGHQTIKIDDFEMPLSFYLGEEALVHTVAIKETVPESLRPSLIRSADNRVTLEPLLLNPKDCFSFWVTVSSYRAPVKAQARIVGIREVQQVRHVANLTSLHSFRVPWLMFWSGVSSVAVMVTASRLIESYFPQASDTLAGKTLEVIFWIAIAVLVFFLQARVLDVRLLPKRQRT